VTYTYDGDGKRVKKSSGTLYYYIPGSGEVLQESDLAGNTRYRYVFFNGKRIVRRNSSSGEILYYFSDHLGSSNVVTNATGTTIKEESDFYPFGGERVVTDTVSDQNYKFTGKERDSESGLDYFRARYYGSNLGRFLTPDWADKPTAVPYAEFADPASLNLYAYVRDNPLNRMDPDGHICILGIGSTCGGEAPPPPPPPPKPPKMQGVNPVTGQEGFSRNPKGEPGHERPGKGGSGQFGASRDGGRRPHRGEDVSGLNHFSMIHATAAGKVQEPKNDPNGFGQNVVIDHGNGVTSIYGHLSVVGAQPGETVREGEIIGVMGATGNAKQEPVGEDHVHFEVRIDNKPIDPAVFLNIPK